MAHAKIDIGGYFINKKPAAVPLGNGAQDSLIKKRKVVEKSAHHGLVLSFHFRKSFLTSSHDQNGMLAVKMHDPYGNIQAAKRQQFPAYYLSFHRHRRKFPETKHLDLCKSGEVRIGRVGLQTANLNPEFLRRG